MAPIMHLPLGLLHFEAILGKRGIKKQKKATFREEMGIFEMKFLPNFRR